MFNHKSWTWVKLTILNLRVENIAVAEFLNCIRNSRSHVTELVFSKEGFVAINLTFSGFIHVHWLISDMHINQCLNECSLQ